MTITKKGSLLTCTSFCEVAIVTEDIKHGESQREAMAKFSYKFGTKEPELGTFPPHLCKCGKPFTRGLLNQPIQLFVNGKWE